MPKPSEPGPKKLPVDKMPTDILTGVLPASSPIGSVVAPRDTGITSAYNVLLGDEPWLFNASTTRLLADLNPGTGNSYLQAAISSNGTLYLSYISNGSQYFAKWDQATGQVTNLLTDATPESWPYSLDAIGAKIYFEVDNDVQAYDSATGLVTTLALPLSGYVTQTDAYNNELFLFGQFANGVDLLRYNPATSAWTSYDLAGTPYGTEAVYLLGGIGSYYITVTPGYNFNVLDLRAAPENALVYTVAAGSFNNTADNDGIWSSIALSFGGDYYLQSSGGLMDFDSADGTLTQVLYNGSPVFGYGMEVSQNSLYLLGNSGTIYKVNENSDGSTNVAAFTTTAVWQDSAILNGTLYYTGYANGQYALCALNESTGSENLLIDFDGPTRNNWVEVVAAVNGSLVVANDRDGDGDVQLWSSSNPSDPNSWIQISPDDVSFTLNYGVLLTGDYLL